MEYYLIFYCWHRVKIWTGIFPIPIPYFLLFSYRTVTIKAIRYLIFGIGYNTNVCICKHTLRPELIATLIYYMNIFWWRLTFLKCDCCKECRQGRIQRGRTRRPPPPKIGKNMIFLRKIVIFHTKYPKNFRASLPSVRFFMCVPLTWNPGSTPGRYTLIKYIARHRSIKSYSIKTASQLMSYLSWGWRGFFLTNILLLIFLSSTCKQWLKNVRGFERNRPVAHCARRNSFATSARIRDEFNFGDHVSVRNYNNEQRLCAMWPINRPQLSLRHRRAW